MGEEMSELLGVLSALFIIGAAFLWLTVLPTIGFLYVIGVL